MKYTATLSEDVHYDDPYAMIISCKPSKTRAMALKHSRAVKSVLRATKIWAKAHRAESIAKRTEQSSSVVLYYSMKYVDAETRLLTAQARLELIESKSM